MELFDKVIYRTGPRWIGVIHGFYRDKYGLKIAQVKWTTKDKTFRSDVDIADLLEYPCECRDEFLGYS